MIIGYVNLSAGVIAEVEVLDGVSNVTKAKFMSNEHDVDIKYATFTTHSLRVSRIYDLSGKSYESGTYRNRFVVEFRVGEKIHLNGETFTKVRIDKNSKKDKYITNENIYYKEVEYTSRRVAEMRAVHRPSYTGEVIEWDKYGNIIAKRNYKEGKIDGVSYTWKENKLSYGYYQASEMNYNDNKLNGRARTWDEFGHLTDENYINNVKHGISMTRLPSTRFFSGGLTVYKYYENGVDVSRNDPMTNEPYTGFYREYDDDDNIIKECYYSKGIPDGIYKKWKMVDGRRIMTDRLVFMKGTINGDCMIWDELKGKPISHKFINNVLI